MACRASKAPTTTPNTSKRKMKNRAEYVQKRDNGFERFSACNEKRIACGVVVVIAPRKMNPNQTARGEMNRHFPPFDSMTAMRLASSIRLFARIHAKRRKGKEEGMNYNERGHISFRLQRRRPYGRRFDGASVSN